MELGVIFMSPLQLDPDAIIWPKNQISSQAEFFSLLVGFYPKLPQEESLDGLGLAGHWGKVIVKVSLALGDWKVEVWDGQGQALVL